MMRFVSKTRIAAVIALAAVTAACSNPPRPQSVAAVQSVDRSEIQAIVTLLDQGERGKAKKRIATALKRDPDNAKLMLLRDSIERSPEDLLGSTYFSYTVQPGDSMSELAQRFLGNSLKAYQLARYNDIERPAALSAGQVLRIPGEQRAEPVRRPEKRPDSQAATPPRPKVSPAPAAVPAPVARPRTTNALAARQARSAGLAALNEGKPGRAVELLTRAVALEPSNPAISRDLQRAQRINATVKARQ